LIRSLGPAVEWDRRYDEGWPSGGEVVYMAGGGRIERRLFSSFGASP